MNDGLLLRHFHEMIRVPALRYRADEIGEIALSILRRLSGGRSVRLSPQVIRVLEGYAWPGNVSELEDVLRYADAGKPLGEIQSPDLPARCFQGRARRMSMLEAAQCDDHPGALRVARQPVQGRRHARHRPVVAPPQDRCVRHQLHRVGRRRAQPGVMITLRASFAAAFLNTS